MIRSGAESAKTTCPNCNQTKIASIVYGLFPLESDGSLKKELQAEVDSGNLILDWTEVLASSPKNKCRLCGHKW